MAVDIEARGNLAAVKVEMDTKFSNMDNKMGVFEGRVNQAMETFGNGLAIGRSICID